MIDRSACVWIVVVAGGEVLLPLSGSVVPFEATEAVLLSTVPLATVEAVLT